MKIYFLILILSLFSSSIVCAQEFAYVTDSLLLRVYAKPSADSEVLQTLESGDSVEVFAAQDGFSQVTTYDNTKGWVKSVFLVEEPPAKLLYYTVGKKNEELEAEIETLKNGTVTNNDSESAQLEELQLALEHQQEVNQTLKEQLDERIAAPDNDVIQDSNKVSSSIGYLNIAKNNFWIILGIVMSLLVIGVVLGMKISSMRLKKRLHGFSL